MTPALNHLVREAAAESGFMGTVPVADWGGTLYERQATDFDSDCDGHSDANGNQPRRPAGQTAGVTSPEG